MASSLRWACCASCSAESGRPGAGRPSAAELRERLAAERAGGRVIGGLAGAGARRAVGCPVQVDQPRVDPAQASCSRSPAARERPGGSCAAAGRRGARARARSRAPRALQVEGQALLALHGLEPGNAVLHLAEGLAADRLDLDHARAEVGEQRRGQRGRDPGGELEHQQVAQRAARSGRAARVRRARRRPRRPGGGPGARRGRAARPGRRGREAHQRSQLPQPADFGILAFDHVAVVEDLRMVHRLGRGAEALDGDVGVGVEDAHPLRMGLLAHPGQHDRAQRPHLLRVAQRRREPEARISPYLVETEVADEGAELRGGELRELEPDAVLAARVRVGKVGNVRGAQHHRVAGQPVHEIVDAERLHQAGLDAASPARCARGRAAPPGSRAARAATRTSRPPGPRRRRDDRRPPGRRTRACARPWRRRSRPRRGSARRAPASRSP